MTHPKHEAAINEGRDGLGVVIHDAASRALVSVSTRYGLREWGGWGDLPQDVLWLTTIEPVRFFKKPATARRHLRCNEYLGARAESILADFCALDAPLVRKLEILHGVMTRVHTLAERFFGCHCVDEDYLHHALQPSLVRADPADTAGASLELEQSGIEFNIQETIPVIVNSSPLLADGRVDADEALIQFHAETDRRAFFTDLEQCLVPVGQWLERPVQKFGATVASQIGTLCRFDQPVLTQVRLIDLHEPVSRITRNAIRAGARRWVTHEELMFLAHFSTLAIERVFVGDRYVRLPGVLSAPLPVLEGHQMQSISMGLVAQNVAMALSAPVIQNGLFLNTSRMAWTLSHFRLKRLKTCLLAGDNFGTILDYSHVGVRWATHQDRLADSVKCAQQAGLKSIVEIVKK